MGEPIEYPEPSEAIKKAVLAKNNQSGMFGGGFAFGRFGQPQSFYTLQHNEYVVYNTDQIQTRYIIQVDTGKSNFL